MTVDLSVGDQVRNLASGEVGEIIEIGAVDRPVYMIRVAMESGKTLLMRTSWVERIAVDKAAEAV